MARTGTLAWAAQTGGRMTHSDRLRFLLEGLLWYSRSLPATLRHRFGLANPIRVDVEAIRVPDSAVARRAHEHLTAVSPAWLVGHCERAFLWASIFAARDAVRHDPELLYVICLLHDLGLVESHQGKYDGVQCFAVEGAYAARDLEAVSTWDAERRDRLAEAITLHLNPRVRPGEGAEAHLLHEGTAFDAIGARFREIHRETRTDVLKRLPRMGAAEGFVRTIGDEARARPASRTAFLCRTGFLGMLRSAPFVD